MRLSPRFVEFLMGLPEGWVTDVPGLNRTEQLRHSATASYRSSALSRCRELLDVLRNPVCTYGRRRRRVETSSDAAGVRSCGAPRKGKPSSSIGAKGAEVIPTCANM